MEHFYHNIGEDWFTYPIFYSSMVNEAIDGAHFVEVGSWKGRSAAYMAVEIHNSNKKIKFDCIDTWKGSVEHINDIFVKEDTLYSEFLKNIEPVKHIINPIRMLSLDACNLYADNSLDFVYIDASHEYEDIKNDILNWLPKVKNNGILAGHDFSWDDVSKAVKEVLPHYDYYANENVWVHKKI
jgi:predicted O-methyltransferase YrrM